MFSGRPPSSVPVPETVSEPALRVVEPVAAMVRVLAETVRLGCVPAPERRLTDLAVAAARLTIG